MGFSNLENSLPSKSLSQAMSAGKSRRGRILQSEGRRTRAVDRDSLIYFRRAVALADLDVVVLEAGRGLRHLLRMRRRRQGEGCGRTQHPCASLHRFQGVCCCACCGCDGEELHFCPGTAG